MTDVPTLAPGCFGSALAYREDNGLCKACVFRDQCYPLHLENLGRLRSHFGITVKTKQTEPVAAPGGAALALANKTRELLERLDRGNYRVVEKLQQGINPFDQSLRFMMLASHLLIKLSKVNKVNNALTRPMLASQYVAKLGLKENTADAYARMAIDAFTHIGAVDNTDGMIRLRRS